MQEVAPRTPDADRDEVHQPADAAVDRAGAIVADAVVAVDLDVDVPVSVPDTAPAPGPDSATEPLGQGDSPLYPDAPERDTSAIGNEVGLADTSGTGGTVGTGDAGSAQDATPDIPLATDAAGGAGAGGSGDDAGAGGATGGAGSDASAAGATGGSISTSSSSSSSGGTAGTTTGGTTTGGTGGTSAGGSGGSSQGSGCKMLLHMDESSWNGTAGEVSDASGNGNNGTAVGAPTTTNTPSKLGRAGLFSGSDYISVPSSATLHAGAAFSVSAWVYPTGLEGTLAPGIVSKRIEYANGTEFAVFVWSGNHVYVDVDSETNRFSSVAVLDNNTWYHIAVVYDGSADSAERVRLYINGQLDTVHPHPSATVPPSIGTLRIGDLPGGGQKFIGVIDEVAFWQRALTHAEVLSLSQ
jgi:hypothetical protein